jgi:hypothetical protein
LIHSKFNFTKYERDISESFDVTYPFVEEGLPLPIFYGELYNREQDMDFDMQKEFYLVKTKIKNNVFISEVNQSDGKNKFDFTNESEFYKLRQLIAQCQNKLRRFVKDSTKRICYIGIPSSESEIHNLPQYIAKKLNINNEVLLVRTDSKQKTHVESTGKRQHLYHELTEGLALENCDWGTYDYIVLMDDVTTSGSSFRMVDKFLISHGVPRNKIVNYAFYKYQTVEKWEKIKSLYQEASVNFESKFSIDGVIWDFDETIVNSRDRKVEVEQNLFNGKGFNYNFYNKEVVYEMYKDLEDIFDILANKSIPYTVVSNRYSLMIKLFKQKLLREKVFPFEQKNGITFYYKEENEKGYRDYTHSDWLIKPRAKSFYGYHTKPAYLSVTDSIKQIKQYSSGNRIIGIGNTKNDIIAYKAAGLETVLVTWGIHYRFNRDYGADHVFHDPRQLLDFLKKNTSGMYSSKDFDDIISLVAEPQVNFDDN